MAIPVSIILVMIICSSFSTGNCRRSLLHEQHATVSIKSETGQVYNCVEFDKQPAFSNPSLNLQVESNIEEIQRKQKHNGFGVHGDGCPIGTVPILVISNDTKYSIPAPGPPQQHCHAVVRTRADDPNKKFWAIGGDVSLYKPQVHDDQWSSARMKIINGGESIEAGWLVYPTIFHDNDAHLYTRFIGEGKDCINTQCTEGFVQVDTQVVVGMTKPLQYSAIKGEQYTWKLLINKDQRTGHWWLSIFTTTNKQVFIGYWPKTMFTSLLKHGSQVEWGGEIGDPQKSTNRPAMGDGVQAAYDTEVSAYFENALYMGRNSSIHIDPEDTEKVQDCYPSYTVLDSGYTGSSLGRTIFFGGPDPPF